MNSGKVLIFSAPSGAGKSTIVQHLIKKYPFLEFSVSATSRSPRGKEINGKDYLFISPQEFKGRIENNEFIEYEEVYPGCYYGTLKSEVERIWNKGNVIVFDIDVMGGANLKQLYRESALSIFVQPPSVETLKTRLLSRGTDDYTAIQKRVAKAEKELSFRDLFDIVLINDNLEECLKEAEKLIEEHFIKN